MRVLCFIRNLNLYITNVNLQNANTPINYSTTYDKKIYNNDDYNMKNSPGKTNLIYFWGKPLHPLYAKSSPT